MNELEQQLTNNFKGVKVDSRKISLITNILPKFLPYEQIKDYLDYVFDQANNPDSKVTNEIVKIKIFDVSDNLIGVGVVLDLTTEDIENLIKERLSLPKPEISHMELYYRLENWKSIQRLFSSNPLKPEEVGSSYFKQYIEEHLK